MKTKKSFFNKLTWLSTIVLSSFVFLNTPVSAQSLYKLQQGGKYDEVRKSLLQAGWQPISNGNYEFSYINSFENQLINKKGYKELAGCTSLRSSDSQGVCTFAFKNETGHILTIKTINNDLKSDNLVFDWHIYKDGDLPYKIATGIHNNDLSRDYESNVSTYENDSKHRNFNASCSENYSDSIFKNVLLRSRFTEDFIQEASPSSFKWKSVVGKWKESVTLLQKIPNCNLNYDYAQVKLNTYQNNIKYARQRINEIDNAGVYNEPSKIKPSCSVIYANEIFHYTVLSGQEWQKSIDLLYKIPKCNPAYSSVQNKILNYQSSINYANQKVNSETSGGASLPNSTEASGNCNYSWQTDSAGRRCGERAASEKKNENSSESSFSSGGRVRVGGYYRKNGTYVRPHYRKR
jgi:hypothetical protein